MTSRADDWRELLDPPAGGLARLRATVESRRFVPRRRWMTAAAVSAAAVIVIAVVASAWPAYLRRERLRTAFVAALASPSAVTVANGAALELPSRRADVRIVFVAALPTDSVR